MSTPQDSVPRGALEQCLRELPNCVVLRNEEDLYGNLHRGGDVDLLVGDLALAERTLIHHLGRPIRISRRSYVREYFYDWGNVDLLPSLEWRGACYLRTEAVFDGRHISERGRPVPRLAHVALVSWLSSLLWGGFFKERYASVIRQAVETDGVAFREALTEATGKTWGDRLWRTAADGHPETSATWASSLRRALWWRACARSPVRTIQRYFAFVIRELRLRIEPPVPWIAILGSNGRRRSALVNEITHRFSESPYAHVKAFQWPARPIARGPSVEPITDSYGGSHGGPIGSDLTLLVLAADWVIGYWTRWVHLRAKGCILAFDSTYFDLIVDSRRYRYGLGMRLARAFSWWLPKPDLAFLLPPEPAEPVRQEHVPSAWIREFPAIQVLNGSLPQNGIVDSVERVMRAWMVDRSAASLGAARSPVIAASRASAEGSNGPR